MTTDIRQSSGLDNIVANTLSRVESVTSPISSEALGGAQDGDQDEKLTTPPRGKRRIAAAEISHHWHRCRPLLRLIRSKTTT